VETIPLTLELRVEQDYDIVFMQDRFIGQLMIGDRPVGPRTVTRIPPHHLHPALTPSLTQAMTDSLIRSFSTELNRAAALEKRLNELEARLADTRWARIKARSRGVGKWLKTHWLES
jgi:hypothetical protein